MAAFTFTVPPKDQQALGELANLPGSQIAALVRALKDATPRLWPRHLAADVAAKVKMNEQDALRFVRLLATMYSVRMRNNLTVDQFSDALMDIASLDLSRELEKSFRKYLKDLLSIESLFITTKASDVAREHEHVLCEARILTDMRPIFGLEDKPCAAVPVHVLRIAYHEGCRNTDTREFFVALTRDNVRQLKQLIERAEAKESSLQEVAEKSGLLWLVADIEK